LLSRRYHQQKLSYGADVSPPPDAVWPPVSVLWTAAFRALPPASRRMSSLASSSSLSFVLRLCSWESPVQRVIRVYVSADWQGTTRGRRCQRRADERFRQRAAFIHDCGRGHRSRKLMSGSSNTRQAYACARRWDRLMTHSKPTVLAPSHPSGSAAAPPGLTRFRRPNVSSGSGAVLRRRGRRKPRDPMASI